MVAWGYPHVPNAAALILGPTGLAFDENTDTLFVASTADNTIYAVAHAGSRTSPATRGAVAFADSHLRGPLALRLAPNGDLLTANGAKMPPSTQDVLHPPSDRSGVHDLGSPLAQRIQRRFPSQGGAFGLYTLPERPLQSTRLPTT